ncbi:jg8593 [Pararge aegeria aegeria]|uniref:Jg8593 protein n=1 Tax=Pararge aegeria aegeria TaxID=348720 RepID=A0A8S4QDE1_9NEOP|nr:jg8593 [Pararge aegeria aegeria]
MGNLENLFTKQEHSERDGPVRMPYNITCFNGEGKHRERSCILRVQRCVEMKNIAGDLVARTSWRNSRSGDAGESITPPREPLPLTPVTMLLMALCRLLRLLTCWRLLRLLGLLPLVVDVYHWLALDCRLTSLCNQRENMVVYYDCSKISTLKTDR